MLVNHDREKLIEAVKFFSMSTKRLGKTKLFKLLYFLDFTHYRDVGRSVTGLEYFAWPMGPVPVSLFDELGVPASDWEGQCKFLLKKTLGGKEMLTVTALRPFDSTHFTKRELRIMAQLAEQFANATADEMIEATHLEHSPWHQIYEIEGKKQHSIPYTLSLRAQDSDFMKGAIEERDEVLSAFRG